MQFQGDTARDDALSDSKNTQTDRVLLAANSWPLAAGPDTYDFPNSLAIKRMCTAGVILR